MALNLAQLADLKSAVQDLKAGFKDSKIKQQAVELPAGNWTVTIQKVEWDVLPNNSSTYILRWTLKVNSAKESENQSYVGAITEKSEWLDLSALQPNKNGIPKRQEQANMIKTSVYGAGIRTETGFVVDDLDLLFDEVNEKGEVTRKSVLGQAVGNIIKLGTSIFKGDKKDYVNMYFNGVVGKVGEQELAELNGDGEGVPF